MVRVLVLACILGSTCLSVVGQNKDRVVCPGFQIVASPEWVNRGAKVTLHAVITGGNLDVAHLHYDWRIISDINLPEIDIGNAQGSSTVTIDTTNIPRDSINAWVQFSPSSECEPMTSQLVAILPAPDERVARPIILSKPEPIVTAAACEAKVSGTAVLRVTFLKTGEIGSVDPIRYLYPVTEEAIAAAKLIKFQPATRDGEAVDFIQVVEYKFRVCS